jgi:transposase-like protein
LVVAAVAGVEPDGETLDDLARKIGMSDKTPYWSRRQLELSRISVAERT